MKDTNTRNIMIAIVILVVIISLIIFLKSPKYKSYEYNGFQFTKVGNLWYTEVQKKGTIDIYIIELRHDPKSLEDIPVVGNPKVFLRELEYFNLTATYITFDPLGYNFTSIALVAADISTNLARVMDIKPLSACVRNETRACTNRPIVTCDNDEYMVIFINESEQAKITKKDNCLIVEGKDDQLIRAANKLILIWYDIIT